MRIIELIIDEEQENGIDAISIVEHPAIEENFIALNQNKKYNYNCAKPQQLQTKNVVYVCQKMFQVAIW